MYKPKHFFREFNKTPIIVQIFRHIDSIYCVQFYRDISEQSLSRLRQRGVKIDRQLNPLYAARLRLEQRIQDPPNHPNLRLQVWWKKFWLKRKLSYNLLRVIAFWRKNIVCLCFTWIFPLLEVSHIAILTLIHSDMFVHEFRLLEIYYTHICNIIE